MLQVDLVLLRCYFLFRYATPTSQHDLNYKPMRSIILKQFFLVDPAVMPTRIITFYRTTYAPCIIPDNCFTVGTVTNPTRTVTLYLCTNVLCIETSAFHVRYVRNALIKKPSCSFCCKI